MTSASSTIHRFLLKTKTGECVSQGNYFSHIVHKILNYMLTSCQNSIFYFTPQFRGPVLAGGGGLDKVQCEHEWLLHGPLLWRGVELHYQIATAQSHSPDQQWQSQPNPQCLSAGQVCLRIRGKNLILSLNFNHADGSLKQHLASLPENSLFGTVQKSCKVLPSSPKFSLSSSFTKLCTQVRSYAKLTQLHLCAYSPDDGMTAIVQSFFCTN